MIVRPLASRQRAREARAEVGREIIASPPRGLLPGLPAGMRVPGVGQIAPGAACPVFPSSMKFLAATTASLAAGATGTLTFSTPGAFCPMKMFLSASIDLLDVAVLSIKSGIEEQIIEGPVPADLFSMDNDCCPVACLKCICAPGVDYVVTVQNNDAMAQTVTAVLVGVFKDACPPGMSTEQFFGSLPDVPGCPRPGGDKLLGFTTTLAMAASGTVELTTPGRFCPRQLFIGAAAAGTGPADVNITGIRTGLKNQIISGSLPATLFTTANECCVLACFDCLCTPGYPLLIDLQNTDAANAATLKGVLVGSYEDSCP